MPLSSKLWSVILLASLVSGGASVAGAEERCSGTLCDFYYGNSGPAAEQSASAAKPAAPTPLMVPSLLSGATAPSGAAAAPTSRVQVQGGGLLGLMRGQPTERCTGTLCDVYYGGSPPEKPEATPPVAADAQAAPVEATAAGDEPDEAPRASGRRHRYETVEREAKPRCASPAQDPWRCYR